MNRTPPKVSIGMPVYNGAATIRDAVASLREQTFTDFELIISDNASNDGTEAICRELADLDNRLRYIRQPKNLGFLKNFGLVLDESVGEYFMWNGCDDVRSKGYIEKNLDFLMVNPDFVGSASPNCFKGDESAPEKWDSFPLEMNLYSRLRRFLDHSWRSHGSFYCLFRKETLLRAFAHQPSKPIFGWDWGIVVDCLMEGRIKRIDQDLLVLGKGGLSDSSDRVRSFHYSPLDFAFPLYRLGALVTASVVSGVEMSAKEKILVLRHLWGIVLQFRFRSY